MKCACIFRQFVNLTPVYVGRSGAPVRGEEKQAHAAKITEYKSHAGCRTRRRDRRHALVVDRLENPARGRFYVAQRPLASDSFREFGEYGIHIAYVQRSYIQCG